MMRKKLLLLCCFLAGCFSARAWGGFEHTVIAYAAQFHLTENAARNIRKYLDQPIYEYAEWMDYTPMHHGKFRRQMKNGHGFTCVDGDFPTENWWHDTEIVSGYPIMLEMMEVLKDWRNQPDSLVTLYLRAVIHTIGDMHCPGHIIFADLCATPHIRSTNLQSDKKRYQKTPLTTKYGMHRAWDMALVIEDESKDLEDWRQLLDVWPEEKQKECCKGWILDYLKDNAVNARKIYTLPDSGMPAIAHEQIQKAIYRMAHILNTLFDNE